MPFSKLPSLSTISSTVEAVRNVHGGYQAIDLLMRAMDEAEPGDSFEGELQEAEKASGLKYEGPAGATRAVLSAAEIAAESPAHRDPLAELLSLVLLRVGSMQGSKLLVGLLVVAGAKPALAGVIIKILLLLMQSPKGREWVFAAWPTLQNHIAPLWKQHANKESLQTLLQGLGQEGVKLLKTIGDSSTDIVQAALDRSDDLFSEIKSVFVQNDRESQRDHEERSPEK